MTDTLEQIKVFLRKERGEKLAKSSDRTIKVELMFWTNGIASTKGKIVPKVCWDFGMVHILGNGSHSIKRSKSPIPFNTFSEIESKIEKGLKSEGIILLKHEKDAKRGFYPRNRSSEPS